MPSMAAGWMQLWPGQAAAAKPPTSAPPLEEKPTGHSSQEALTKQGNQPPRQTTVPAGCAEALPLSALETSQMEGREQSPREDCCPEPEPGTGSSHCSAMSFMTSSFLVSPSQPLCTPGPCLPFSACVAHLLHSSPAWPRAAASCCLDILTAPLGILLGLPSLTSLSAPKAESSLIWPATQHQQALASSSLWRFHAVLQPG